MYCSHLSAAYLNQPGLANELIKDYYSFKTDDFTTINLVNDRLSAERNQVLQDFYNRELTHQLMRIKFIRHVTNIFMAQGNKENLVVLARKMLKLNKMA